MVDKATPIFRAQTYCENWKSWSANPVASAAGLIVDHTPSGPIFAPDDKIRVCLYHIDFDQRPTCYLDVNSVREAEFICENFSECRGDWNVDYALAYDSTGTTVAAYRLY